MFVFFLIIFLFSITLEAKAEENFDQHSFLEIVPKDSFLYDKKYFYFGVKITLIAYLSYLILDFVISIFVQVNF